MVKMPRTALPPTPASSTDIKGQDGTKLATLQLAFELPPPAITPTDMSSNSMTTQQQQQSPAASSLDASAAKTTSTNTTPYPMQASEAVKSRRRSSAAQGPPKDQFALPPPPTRSRKIIQMKPREEVAPESPPASVKSAPASKGGAAAAAAAGSAGMTAGGGGSGAGGSKRKQPSATSAAGRKIARKTAHSLIERRRRSKMNEEFAVLKGMIPACTGEMHKLAILQASIEYIRYLEDCVTKLKTQRGPDSDMRISADMGLPTPSGREPYNPDRSYGAYTDDRSTDVEMAGSEAPSPTFTANPGRSQQPSISPALLAEDSRHRQNSYSSASTADHRHYSYSASATTSPAFGPQVYGYAPSSHSASGSTLTSPALLPQRDLDQEATAALLMLNQTDRRGPGAGGAAGRGMSVRDLLTT